MADPSTTVDASLVEDAATAVPQPISELESLRLLVQQQAAALDTFVKNQQSVNRGKKVGADGLTKKERRALKAGAEKNVEISNAKTNTIDESLNQPKNNVAVNSKSSKGKLQNDSSTPIKSQVKNHTESPPKADTQKSQKTLDAKIKENEKETLSKAEIKAQRRAVQEAQRQAKANQKLVVTPNNNNQATKENIKQNEQNIKLGKKVSPKIDLIKSPIKHRVQLFNHLYVGDFQEQNLKRYTLNKDIHPAFLQLGAQYLSRSILGSNARCLAMLSALKTLTNDFRTPPKQEFCRSLESTLKASITHLNTCRPLAVSMTNALRQFKLLLTQIDTNLSDNEKRSLLQERIDKYIQEEIEKAGEAISNEVNKKISDNDIILIYGYSSLILRILVDAQKAGKKFRVVIVDARPLLEGREMLRRLVCANIECSYLLINAVSFVMSRVTKVLLGAHALLANGYVMSRTGTAQVALVANSFKKPVLVCCETYKFCERVQTDSFVYNEIADPDKVVTVDASEKSSYLLNWRDNNYLTPLNLMYDVTPSDFVTAVVTEIAVLPCTSVPVILRIRPVE
ncbi:hypothetical protein RI129_007537 [Pyrocoelia pectoralis]|uniref:Translation initiation factor eIF2B subunit delta n=1 Tax=Pyrocoelia pectoralis TaxID=417401 RepID=A0AAN7V9V5_9COLE